jgi:glycosyltransferase involved in cell wall biosynthesis
MRRPVPILFTIPNFITAGSGRALFNVVSRLNRSRYAPSIAVLRRGGDLESEIDEAGIALLELPFAVAARPYITLPTRAVRAARGFRPHGFRLWHSYHYCDDYTEPLIAHLSGARYWVYTKKNMGWGSRAWFVRSLMATRIAAQNSDMTRKFFAKSWLRGKVRPLARGVDVAKFQPEGERRLRLRESLGLSNGMIAVGCVAHLVPVKGHQTLIEAIARVPAARLLIAGDPLDADYHAALVARCAVLGVTDRVHFLGEVKDVPAFLVELDVFVLPTWAKWRMEGCPVALLEAMACGLPCIATDIPGSRDLVEQGRSGWIVPPEDPDAMANALRELAGSPERRRSLGEEARERVVGLFSIEKEVAAHEALYAELFGLDCTAGPGRKPGRPCSCGGRLRWRRAPAFRGA